jgi:hypothetical protein
MPMSRRLLLWRRRPSQARPASERLADVAYAEDSDLHGVPFGVPGLVGRGVCESFERAPKVVDARVGELAR